MNNETTILALAGKGGVGKTSLSALTVRSLLEAHPNSRILAIDADPAVGLATALGVEVSATVDDIRRAFVQTAEQGNASAAVELLGEAKFRLLDALEERGNLSFLAIGRPEAAGCYCKVNAYLKEVITRIAAHFDYVVIDGEAGIEQINRRVMETVTHLILVSDGSKKGLQVAKTIQRVAGELVMYRKSGTIINRLPDTSLLPLLDTEGLEVLAVIGDDPKMTYSDLLGNSVFSLGADTAVCRGVKQALSSLNLI